MGIFGKSKNKSKTGKANENINKSSEESSNIMEQENNEKSADEMIFAKEVSNNEDVLHNIPIKEESARTDNESFETSRFDNVQTNVAENIEDRYANDPDAQDRPKLKIVVSFNKLTAAIRFSRPSSKTIKPWSESLIMEELKLAGIVFGIDPRMVKRACAFPMYDIDINVAQGIPPVKGKNGYVEYHYKNEKGGKPVIREDGTVDYKDVGFAVPIRKGELLCSLFPPEEGIDGTDVYGQTITAPIGDNYVFMEGKNVRITEDGRSVVAAVGGTLELGKNSIGVIDTLFIREGISHSTGNVFTYGNLLINEVVRSGFEVTAEGDIEVKGYVEGAKLVAGNDIKISLGVKGMGKGQIIAGGNITFPFAENATIDAGGGIIADTIVNCNIKCGEDLQATGKKGVIMGGSAEVSGNLVVKSIGTMHSTPTIIIMNKRGYAAKEVRDLIKEREDTIEKMIKMDPTIDLFKRMGDVTRLPQEKLEYFKNVLNEYKELQMKHDKLTEEIDHVLELKNKNAPPQMVKCSGYLYAGTKVTFSDDIHMNVENDLHKVSLYVSEGEVQVGTF